MPDKIDYIPPFVATAVAQRGSLDSRCIEAREPGKATLALEMLAAGDVYDKIAEATGLSVTTVAALKARHPMVLEERRKLLATDAFTLAEGLRQLALKKVEMMSNDPAQLEKTNIRDIVLPYGISFDKGMMAIGEGNRVIVEHVSGKPSIADAQKVIAEARERLKQQSVEIPAVDVTPKEAGQ